MSKRVMLLGVYGMEAVECGGALALNAKNGGESYVSIMLAREDMQRDVTKACEILGVKKVYFNGFKYGYIDHDYEHKVALIKVIREVRPDIIITQDPEHCVHDLDPDRRPAMTLILEAIALASRDFALDETPGLDPHPIPKIYYMSPMNPNCTVNIADVWDLKERGMDVLESQMEFTSQVMQERMTKRELEIMAPGFFDAPDDVTRGRMFQTAYDKSLHMYHGVCGHGNFALAEAYRYEGKFEFMELW